MPWPEPIVPGQKIWVYMTFTNPDAIVPTSNPIGLVNPEPIAVTAEDPGGNLQTLTPVFISLGYYRAQLTLSLGGGSYTIRAQGSQVGADSPQEMVVRVGRGSPPAPPPAPTWPTESVGTLQLTSVSTSPDGNSQWLPGGPAIIAMRIMWQDIVAHPERNELTTPTIQVSLYWYDSNFLPLHIDYGPITNRAGSLISEAPPGAAAYQYGYVVVDADPRTHQILRFSVDWMLETGAVIAVPDLLFHPWPTALGTDISFHATPGTTTVITAGVTAPAFGYLVQVKEVLEGEIRLSAWFQAADFTTIIPLPDASPWFAAPDTLYVIAKPDPGQGPVTLHVDVMARNIPSYPNTGLPVEVSFEAI